MTAPDAATIEAGLAQLDDLAAVHEAIGRCAAKIADASVAVLSLSPVVSRDPVALGFASDAMTACADALRELHALQGAASRVLDSTARTLDEVLSGAESHSRKV